MHTTTITPAGRAAADQLLGDLAGPVREAAMRSEYWTEDYHPVETILLRHIKAAVAEIAATVD